MLREETIRPSTSTLARGFQNRSDGKVVDVEDCSVFARRNRSRVFGEMYQFRIPWSNIQPWKPDWHHDKRRPNCAEKLKDVERMIIKKKTGLTLTTLGSRSNPSQPKALHRLATCTTSWAGSLIDVAVVRRARLLGLQLDEFTESNCLVLVWTS